MTGNVSTAQPRLSSAATDKLREGLATCRSKHALSPEAHEAVVALCAEARGNGWTPEQLIVAVKDAYSASHDISPLTTTSEREAFLATLVTSCIQEFFRKSRAD